jgi:hypothetical protein
MTVTTSPSTDSRRLLAVYLNDHLAGATAGVELADRLARGHRNAESGPKLAKLAKEIAEDRQTLLEFMQALGFKPRRNKILLGWLGERPGASSKMDGSSNDRHCPACSSWRRCGWVWWVRMPAGMPCWKSRPPTRGGTDRSWTVSSAALASRKKSSSGCGWSLSARYSPPLRPNSAGLLSPQAGDSAHADSA